MGKKRKIGGSVRFPDAPGTASKKQRSSGPPAKKGPQGKQPGQQGLANKANKKKHQQYHRNQEPVVPFEPHENILLVGEGDLSLAASLAVHHGCRNLTATVLEKSEAELLEKYPHAGENIAKILRPGGVGGEGDEHQGRGEEEEHKNGDFGSDGSDLEDQDSDSTSSSHSTSKRKRRLPPLQSPNRNRILYNTDATTLKAFTTTISTTTTTTPKGAPPPPPRRSAASDARPNHKSPSKPETKTKPDRQKRGIFSHIIFNFPHVGGKSTDVNRQVRHNQSLLVAFFQRALPSLAPGGSIIVTLFEGEPYTLWNVRDLARHAGLAVDTSFRFPWSAYPGYRHARTLGVVRSRGDRRAGGSEKEEQDKEKGEDKDDESDEGKEEEEDKGRPHEDAQVTRQGESKTAWRGEERPARSYVFVRKEEMGMANSASKKSDAKKNKKKKRGNQDADDSDSDSDVSD